MSFFSCCRGKVQRQPVPVWKDCVVFVPPISSGIVIKVYDGDTVTVATRLPFRNSPLYRFPVRLRGIDAPEMHGSSDDEREMARISQQALQGLLLNKTVTLQNVGTEKYGRVLADVLTPDGICASTWMLGRGLAVPYFGKTKKGRATPHPDPGLDLSSDH